MNNQYKTQSQSWQRAARVGDTFVIRGPKNEVIWGKVLDNDTENITPSLRADLIEDMRRYNIPISEVRCVQLNANYSQLPIYTIMHVSLIEMFIPNHTYDIAKTINWPSEPISIIGLMSPMTPLVTEFYQDHEPILH